MQDPESGRLLPVPGDNPKNAPPDWPIYKVGARVKFRGWWWEIVDVGDGRITVEPFSRAPRSEHHNIGNRSRCLHTEEKQ